jgi:hypothetical protein
VAEFSRRSYGGGIFREGKARIRRSALTAMRWSEEMEMFSVLREW